MCVCRHPIQSGRQTCGRSGRGHTGFLHLPFAVLAYVFIARMTQPALSLVDREVEFLCAHELIVLHWLGMVFIYIYIFFLGGIIPVRVTATRFEVMSQR